MAKEDLINDRPLRAPKGWKELHGSLAEVSAKRAFRLVGQPELYSNAADLLYACLAYFKWLEENPILESRLVVHQGEHSLAELPKMRPATLRGLCGFIGCSRRTWADWRTMREDLVVVIEWAEDMIYENKYVGAASGTLNANIVARDLGLVEKTEVESKQTVVNIKGDSADL